MTPTIQAPPPAPRWDSSAYKVHRELQIYRGQWRPYVDAQQVRDHLATLTAYQLPPEAIGRLTGVSPHTIKQIMNGLGHRGREQNTRVRRKVAARIMAFQFDLDAIPDRMWVDGAGTRRRVQALTAIGYSLSEQAAYMGRGPSQLQELSVAPRVMAITARQVRNLYDQLSMRPSQHRLANRARMFASKRGWIPPLAWDDDLIDLPDSLLGPEITRLVGLMDWAELARCDKSRRNGEVSPLIVAASREYRRQSAARRKSKTPTTSEELA